MTSRIKKWIAVIVGAVALAPMAAMAHEAYVLTPQQFHQGLATWGTEEFASLKNPHDLHLFLIITISVIVVFALNFVFRQSRLGKKVDATFRRLEYIGPLFVRAAIAASFFYSAWTWSFLGPELSLRLLPFAHVARIAMFVISFLFLFGWWTELGALVALVLFGIGTWKFGAYSTTYLNYFGEIVVLLLFGSRRFSLDKLVYGATRRLKKLQPYETTIVRICYGIALSYAAITIKLLHPILTLTVVKEYHLTQFHWLFPGDPLLIVLGAALAELAIGIFVTIGFETRLTVVVSLFYITLSLLYFKEAVWPHLMLYGISLNLIVATERFSLDSWFAKHPLPFMRKRNKTT
jgi:hypothetical protein